MPIGPHIAQSSDRENGAPASHEQFGDLGPPCSDLQHALRLRDIWSTGTEDHLGRYCDVRKPHTTQQLRGRWALIRRIDLVKLLPR